MPLFDQMYYDQKWSLWDTWLASVFRNVRGYVMTAAYRMGNVVTTQKGRGQVVTSQKGRGEVITSGG